MSKLHVKLLSMPRVEMVRDLYIPHMFAVHAFLRCIYGLLNSSCIDIPLFSNLENANCLSFFKNRLISLFYCYIRCFSLINTHGFTGSRHSLSM